jgi:Ring finger domain
MTEPRRCGASTLTGGLCKTIVRDEGQERCWQHRGSQCSVCLANMGGQSNTRKLNCGHEFHGRCLNRWKLQCTETPTCPMCREPFDIPTYKCRLIIERTSDSFRNISDFETSNIANILDGFGLQFRELIPQQGGFITDIRFDIDPEETLRDVLRGLGLPEAPPDV